MSDGTGERTPRGPSRIRPALAASLVVAAGGSIAWWVLRSPSPAAGTETHAGRRLPAAGRAHTDPRAGDPPRREAPTSREAGEPVLGVVVDHDGMPIEGARVDLHEVQTAPAGKVEAWDVGEQDDFSQARVEVRPLASTVTDEAGRFALARDASGTPCYVIASAEGMLRSDASASGALRITLHPIRVCHLRIVDEEGRAISGAHVQARNGPDVLVDERTGPDGTVRVATSVEGHVAVGAPGFATQVIDESPCGFDAAARETRIVLGPPRSLRGRVLADGAPAAGARIRADRFRTTADSEGRFEVAGLGAQKIPLSAESGSLRTWLDVDLAGGSVDDLEVVLPSPPRLVVHVRDERGEPVRDARVWVGGGPSADTQTTDASGSATLRLEPGLYGLEVRGMDRADELREIDLRGAGAGSTRELEVTLHPGHPFWVRFEHASGRPAQVDGAVLVPLDGVARPERLSAGVVEEGTGFASGLPPGRYELRWEIPGSVPLATGARPVEIPADRRIVVRFPPTASIGGVVLDPLGAPAPGVRVGAAALADTLQLARAEATTDEHGAFAIEGLSPGDWMVFVRDAGLVAADVRARTGTGTAVLRLTTDRIAIEGTIVRPDRTPLDRAAVIALDANGFPVRSFRADAGRFWFVDLPPGSYGVTAATPDLESAAVETRGGAPVELVLDRPASLDARLGAGPWRGTRERFERLPVVLVDVVHADGRPAYGCWLEWSGRPAEGLGAAPCRGNAGAVPLSGPGTLRIRARGPGGAASAPVDLGVVDRLPPPLRLVLEPASTAR